MVLDYLIFDATDNGDDTGTWEALASVDEAQWPALWAEGQALLALAQKQAPGPRGPQEEGGVWDAELQEQRDGPWRTLTFTLTGPWEWGEALLAGLQAGH